MSISGEDRVSIVDYQTLFSKSREELDDIGATVAKVDKFLDVLAEYHEDEDSFDMMVAGISVNLYAVCRGAEQLFTHIANKIDNYMPTGAQWQKKLFEQMGVAIVGKRPRVIRPDTLSFLLELRGYKVTVSGGFSQTLDEQKIIAMALRLPEGFTAFKTDCLAFHQTLSQTEHPISPESQPLQLLT